MPVANFGNPAAARSHCPVRIAEREAPPTTAPNAGTGGAVPREVSQAEGCQARDRRATSAGSLVAEGTALDRRRAARTILPPRTPTVERRLSSQTLDSQPNNLPSGIGSHSDRAGDYVPKLSLGVNPRAANSEVLRHHASSVVGRRPTTPTQCGWHPICYYGRLGSARRYCTLARRAEPALRLARLTAASARICWR